jgi:hypothetical protein
MMEQWNTGIMGSGIRYGWVNRDACVGDKTKNG